MAAKTPIRGVFDGATATGLAEYQSGDFIALTHGGLGASLSIGSAGQVLKVNSGASALEFGSVETIVNIDGANNLESQTLVAGDKLLVSDGGTEGRILLSQLDTLYSGTTKTLTNKTISGSSNTLSNIATSSLTGTITSTQLAGSIANAKLSNSGFTLVDTSSTSTTISLGETLQVQGTTNEVEVSLSGDTMTVGLPNNVTIAGNLTVSGEQTTVSSTTINVADPLLSMATNNNAADAVDIGFYGLYDTSGSQDLHAGVFRDASDSGKWKIFKDLQPAPTTTVNTDGTGYAVGTLVANLEGNVTGNVTGNTSGTSGSTTGNAATATILAAARNINGVSFNGSTNIDIGSVTSGSTSITSNLGSMALNSERLDIPVGFITINIGGTNYKLPYYSV